MFATVHEVSGLPGPLDDPSPAVGAAVSAVRAPDGMVFGRPLTPGHGTLVAFWTRAEDAQGAADPRAWGTGGAEALTFGPSPVFEVVSRHGLDGRSPRYAQLVRFAGPRTERWVRAADRADKERIRPAVEGVPGFAGALTLQAADGERISLVLADDVDTFDEGLRRLMSTQLLPGEDPADLTGPDRVELVRVVTCLIPAGVAS